jgi:hypothetical protein
VTLSKQVVGIIMAFGAGTLISAISYELIFEFGQLGRFTGLPLWALLAGAFTFFAPLDFMPTEPAIASGRFEMKTAANIARLMAPPSRIPKPITIDSGTPSKMMANTMRTISFEPRQDPFAVVHNCLTVRCGVSRRFQSLRRRSRALDNVRAGICGRRNLRVSDNHHI